MSGRGWIALHRKIQDNFLWKEPRVFSKAEAWIDILMEAQHSPEPQEVGFGMTVLRCNYAECLKSIATWAARWPEHVVCAWMGNSKVVARKHYLQVTEEHFEQAAQYPAEREGIEQNDTPEDTLENAVLRGDTAEIRTIGTL